nr:hypothetical protein [Tanacetum cinerariifolium]
MAEEAREKKKYTDKCVKLFVGQLVLMIVKITNEHRSNRAMMKSLAQSMAVEDNILDAWSEYLNFKERLRNASSPLRFLPTFVVTEEFKNAKLSAEVRYNLFKDYMQKAIVKDQRWMNFKDVELDLTSHLPQCMFDVGTGRISILTINTEKYHSDVLAISQG